jgi:HD-like signal output (HDOD) protein
MNVCMIIPGADSGGNEKANQTVGRITTGLESQMVPMVSQIVRIIRDISGKVDHMSVNDLAEYIKSEPTTMERIITIAGSVGYNSSGAEIKSIHHAISLIGFEQVRMLAVSILLFENAQSKYAAEINRQLAGSALISGLVAAELGRCVMPSGAEAAFICGALRGYGRMLAATFMPEEYAIAAQVSVCAGQDEAFRAVFGLTSVELGRQLLENMNLPKFVLDSLVTLAPQFRKRASGDPSNAMIAAAEMGLRVAELIESPATTSFNFESRMEALSREYDPVFYLSPTASRELLHHVAGVLDGYRSRAGSYVGSVVVFRRLESLARDNRLAPSSVFVFKPVQPPPVVIAPVKIFAKPVEVGNFEI